ncbi:MAG TPA: hypothetical protein VNB87_03615 [Propionibacteriaceae bacterium]|nr:hypothetical protein [Propionibacteriaceae bacterium]
MSRREPAEPIGARTPRGDFTRRPQLIARTVGLDALPLAGTSSR